MPKVMLNAKSAPGTAIVTGIMASVIGTAPRKPTQEIKPISRMPKRNGNNELNTAIGRATNNKKIKISNE